MWIDNPLQFDEYAKKCMQYEDAAYMIQSPRESWGFFIAAHMSYTEFIREDGHARVFWYHQKKCAVLEYDIATIDGPDSYMGCRLDLTAALKEAALVE